MKSQFSGTAFYDNSLSHLLYDMTESEAVVFIIMKTEPIDKKEQDRIKAENDDDEFQIGGEIFEEMSLLISNSILFSVCVTYLLV